MKKTLICIFLLLSMLLSSCNFGGEDNPENVIPDAEDGGNEDTDECKHEDKNDDGSCDDCHISVISVIDFYALNDLHGKLDDASGCVGVDELTTYLKNAYKTDDAAILLSSGDMWQGSSESNLTKGAIITEWMNELDFVSMTLGNHEFDWGVEYIESNANLAEFPFLAINIVEKRTGERPEYLDSSVLIERCGIKIGIIGAIGDCKSSISAGNVTDVDFKVGSALTNLVKAEANKLRSQGADFIVYSIHDGDGSDSYDYSMVLSDGYVDLVFEGHSHWSYVNQDSYGIYHLQNGGYDDGISHVEISYNTARDEYDVNIAEIVDSSSYQNLEDDPSVDALLDKYEQVISVAKRPVGFNSGRKSGTAVRQLVADLYLEAGLKKWSDEYDIVLGGGFISIRSPGYLKSGEIIYGDLMDILPFDNTVVLCSVSGSKLLSQFINSTHYSYFISLSDYGEDIKSSVDPSDTYYIVTDTYCSEFAPNGLTVIDVLEEGVYARDLIADYITAGGMESFELKTISEINEICLGLGENVTSENEYYVVGTITEITNGKYGNAYIADDDGNTLYIYGIKQNDALYQDIADKPVVGDKVMLRGSLLYYFGQTAPDGLIEMKNAELIEIIQ